MLLLLLLLLLLLPSYLLQDQQLLLLRVLGSGRAGVEDEAQHLPQTGGRSRGLPAVESVAAQVSTRHPEKGRSGARSGRRGLNSRCPSSKRRGGRG